VLHGILVIDVISASCCSFARQWVDQSGMLPRNTCKNAFNLISSPAMRAASPGSYQEGFARTVADIFYQFSRNFHYLYYILHPEHMCGPGA